MLTTSHLISLWSDRAVPVLTVKEDHSRHLTRQACEDLEADREEVVAGDEAAGRSLSDKGVPGPGPAHEDRDCGGDDQIYVEELSVAKVGLVGVED